jgi:hypothetical protein
LQWKLLTKGFNMAAISTAIAVGAGLFAVGKAVEITEGRKAADAADRSSQANLEFQQRRYAKEREQSEISNVRSMRQNIRASRLAQGTMTNTAANKGGIGGSGLAGGLGSVASQTSGNINFMMQQAQTNASIGSDMIATAGRVGAIDSYGRRSAMNAQVGSGVAGIGSTVFGSQGGAAAFTGAANSAGDAFTLMSGGLNV